MKIKSTFKLHNLSVAIIACLSSAAYAEDYFDPDLLSLGNRDMSLTDLSAFSEQGYSAPGVYIVDIYVNGNYLKTDSIRFEHDKTNTLKPLFSLNDLNEIGVNLHSLKGTEHLPHDRASIDNLSLIPFSSFVFDNSKQRLNINVAQVHMQKETDNRLARKFWDQGIPALFVNYSYSGSQGQTRGNKNKSSTTSDFLSLNAGANLGAWRLRSNMNWTQSGFESEQYDTFEDAYRKQKSSQSKWDTGDTYLQRDVQFLNSELTIGDYRTTSITEQLIDGFQFRGVSLSSSEYMIPAALRGFAPVITGYARTNAEVIVTQNGYSIYQTHVAPGPFRIDDLPGGSSAGDIYVSVKESDGTVHGFRQAYSTLPEMQRQGDFKFEYSVGRYKQSGYSTYENTPLFSNTSFLYGLPHNVTAMGNLLYSGDYQSVSLGAAFSLGMLGTLSTSVTSSVTEGRDNDKLRGYSVNARYSKSLTETGTLFQLASYRYSTPDFRTFSEANVEEYRGSSYINYMLSGRRKDTWSLILNQSITSGLSVGVSGRRDNYWDRHSTTSLSAGLNGTFRQTSWSLNYNIDRVRGNGSWPENRELSLSVSVPFSAFMSSGSMSSANFNYRTAHNNQGRTTNMVSLNGSALEENRLSWNISENWSNSSRNYQRDENFSAGVSYDSQYARLYGGYGRTSQSNTYNYGASGSLLAHPGGVIVSRQNIGNAAALVHVPDVPGARVMNGRDIHTDNKGFALVPYVAIYEKNNITIDPVSLSDGIELPETSKATYPTKGAIVSVEYKVYSGQQALINLTHDGKPVPLGAFVTIGDQVFIVGHSGQVYVSGVPESGRLKVKWGDKESYVANYKLNAKSPRHSESDEKWRPLQEINVVL
ncbi:fimbrial biogenesis outer membrane usher protein [Escherichia coli]|uniref:fimbria/pilus outer membrane usher protein n=1 Tax=Enterobacteriaceae TaxID=543 RepID=UPI0009369D8B|nr:MULTISPECIES: fimbria/pilus outer membrane usher protein [Enterobacteriaceae]EHT7060013.1 fimbrial biogenesis outer membrane usher protein [Escherichia coli]EJD5910079.1 fimbrial biogenesis outer membrane usher protein [Escherichia coli]ELI4094142.1 fimbrial biogenesis outer membrane usher protein [Escherichia coli]MCV5876443.1 fimbrial biogenesis outer membrane usher protein [Escherichia coli]MCY0484798.1 fimbrial biogenesis outer membrane usher protein [Klebsiella pneumoniae]